MRKRCLTRSRSFLVAVLIALGLPSSVLAAKATVAVVDFKLAERAGPAITHQIQTSAFTEQLKSALVQSRKFQVLERQDLDQLLDELQLSNSKVGDRVNHLRRGKVRGAQYIVTGEISVFKAVSSSRPIPGTNRFKTSQEGIAICDVRVIDTENSVIVTASPVEVRLTNSALTREAAEYQPDELFWTALSRRLVTRITQKIIDTVYPIKVIGVAGNSLYLNRGEGSGLKVGDHLAVFEQGHALKDPDTGEILGAMETKVAEIEVTEVLPKLTKATVLNPGALVSEGMIARATN